MNLNITETELTELSNGKRGTKKRTLYPHGGGG